MLNKNELYKISKPYLTCLEMNKYDFDNFLNQYRMDEEINNVVLLLRGEKLKSVTSLFNEVSAAFQFPSYFGNNWNALDECINDLDWLPGDNYIIGINDIQHILIDEEIEDLDIFFKLLNNTCEEWSVPLDLDEEWGRMGKPFHFILQYEKENREIVRKRLSKYLNILPV